MRNLYKYLLISTFFFLYFSKSYAACPSGDNNQTVNIIAGEACTTRISNPTSNVNVAGTNIVSNRGDGSLYWNTDTHGPNPSLICLTPFSSWLSQAIVGAHSRRQSTLLPRASRLGHAAHSPS